MKHRTLQILLVCLTLLLAACSSTPSGWETVEYPEFGIRFSLPEEWASEANDEVINIVASEMELGKPIGQGAGISITPATSSDFDGFGDPDGVLRLFMEYFENSRDLIVRSGPESIIIQGEEAATITYKGTVRDQTGTFTATVITKEAIIVLILAIDGSTDEQYQETLMQITESIVIDPTNGQN